MMIHYIYHIPERNKIGVTIDLSHRMKRHKWNGPYEILETHEDPQIAGDRELELQEQYGYPKDKAHYMVSRASFLRGSYARKPRPNGSSPAQLAQLARVRDPQKAANARKRIKCKHCGLEGLTGNINRWHNDNCKKR